MLADYVPDQDKKHQAGLKGWKEPKLLLHQTSRHALGRSDKPAEITEPLLSAE